MATTYSNIHLFIKHLCVLSTVLGSKDAMLTSRAWLGTRGAWPMQWPRRKPGLCSSKRMGRRWQWRMVASQAPYNH